MSLEGGGGGAAAAAGVGDPPRGTTPDAICKKVVYWVLRRRLLFDQAREALGDLMFSKTTDEVEHARNAATDGEPRKEQLDALLENNAKLQLNLNERIVRDVYFGEVKDLKKAQRRAVEYAKLLSANDVLATLLGFFEGLNFETRKAVEKLFSALVKQNYGDFITEYFLPNVERVLDPILRGGFREHAVFSTVSAHMVFCASMLRHCLEVDKLHPKLQPSTVQPIFEYIVTGTNLECMIALANTGNNFEIVSDAMATLKQIMLCDYFGKFFYPVNKPIQDCTDEEKHRRLRYLQFIRSYQQPIVDLHDYSIVVPMLNGLGEMLLKRSNHGVMMKYISDRHNLKVILEALRRKSSKVRSEAFHILKIFIVNPKQSYVVRRLLAANADKIERALMDDFGHFQNDETLTAELTAVLATVRALPQKHADSPDRDPAFYVITQADEEQDIGVHDAAAFRQLQADKLLAAYHHAYDRAAGGDESAAGAEGEAKVEVEAPAQAVGMPREQALHLLHEDLRRVYKPQPLSDQQLEVMVAAPPARAPTATWHYGVSRSVFDIVYLYSGFADRAEALTYYEDMGLEGRTGVLRIPEPEPEPEPAPAPQVAGASTALPHAQGAVVGAAAGAQTPATPGLAGALAAPLPAGAAQ